MRKLFLSISETAFGFTGVTKQMAEVQSFFPDAIAERPTIEDIMLANIGGQVVCNVGAVNGGGKNKSVTRFFLAANLLYEGKLL